MCFAIYLVFFLLSGPCHPFLPLFTPFLLPNNGFFPFPCGHLCSLFSSPLHVPQCFWPLTHNVIGFFYRIHGYLWWRHCLSLLHGPLSFGCWFCALVGNDSTLSSLMVVIILWVHMPLLPPLWMASSNLFFMKVLIYMFVRVFLRSNGWDLMLSCSTMWEYRWPMVYLETLIPAIVLMLAPLRAIMLEFIFEFFVPSQWPHDMEIFYVLMAPLSGSPQWC